MCSDNLERGRGSGTGRVALESLPGSEPRPCHVRTYVGRWLRQSRGGVRTWCDLVRLQVFLGVHFFEYRSGFVFIESSR